MSGASQAGIGALLTSIIGATSTAASSAGRCSTRVRSSRCPPIEWPMATCGPGPAARQSAIRAARSSTSGSKLVETVAAPVAPRSALAAPVERGDVPARGVPMGVRLEIFLDEIAAAAGEEQAAARLRAAPPAGQSIRRSAMPSGARPVAEDGALRDARACLIAFIYHGPRLRFGKQRRLEP